MIPCHCCVPRILFLYTCTFIQLYYSNLHLSSISEMHRNTVPLTICMDKATYPPSSRHRYCVFPDNFPQSILLFATEMTNKRLQFGSSR